MILMNKLFAVAFAALGTCALCGAIFCGATWHYGTTAMCMAMVTVFYLENKTIKSRKL